MSDNWVPGHLHNLTLPYLKFEASTEAVWSKDQSASSMYLLGYLNLLFYFVAVYFSKTKILLLTELIKTKINKSRQYLLKESPTGYS